MSSDVLAFRLHQIHHIKHKGTASNITLLQCLLKLIIQLNNDSTTDIITFPCETYSFRVSLSFTQIWILEAMAATLK
jgi:hypothetical protein